jgi:hypothetical protein
MLHLQMLDEPLPRKGNEMLAISLAKAAAMLASVGPSKQSRKMSHIDMQQEISTK